MAWHQSDEGLLGAQGGGGVGEVGVVAFEGGIWGVVVVVGIGDEAFAPGLRHRGELGGVAENGVFFS